MRAFRISSVFFLLCTSVLCFSGCGTTGSLFRDPARLVRDPGQLIGRPKTEKSVVRIVSLWEAANGKDPSGKPARGFAGQILFFGPNATTGARVLGKVVITEYDNYDPDSGEEPEPLHSFTFEPDAWDVHRTEGTLGHSYSCFIPYMNKQKNQVKCGLKVEFTGNDGRKVSSEIIEVLLPSRSASASAAAQTRGFVREAQLGVTTRVEGGGEDHMNSPRMESYSIPLPAR